MQGQLRREERLTFKLESSCACCGRDIHFRMDGDLRYTLAEPEAAPVFMIPLVDFTRLRAPNITHDF